MANIVPSENTGPTNIVPSELSTSKPVDEDEVNYKATLASLALNRVEVSDDVEDLAVVAQEAKLNALKDKIRRGQEKQLRDEVALKATNAALESLRNDPEFITSASTPEEISAAVSANPDTVLEREASAALVESGASDPVRAAVIDAEGEKLDAAQEQLYRLARFDREIKRLEEKAKEQGIFTTVQDWVEMFIPARVDQFVKGRVKGAKRPLFAGESQEAQRQFLFSQSVTNGDFDKAMNQVVTDIEKNLFGPNNTLALQFLRSLRGQSPEERVAGNIFTVVDYASVLPIGAAGKILRKPITVLRAAGNRKGAIDVAKSNYNKVIATQNKTPLIEAGDSAVGRTSVSGTRVAATQAEKEDVIDNILPSGMTTSEQFGPGISGELLLELEKQHARRAALAEDIAVNTPRTPRLSPEQTRLGEQLADEELNALVGDGILVDFTTGIDPASKTMIRRAFIGNGRGKLKGFPSEEAAENAARDRYLLPEGKYEIDDSGGVYFIRVFDAVNEADPQIRALHRIDPKNIPVTNRHDRFIFGADSLLDSIQKKYSHLSAAQMARLNSQFNKFLKDLRGVPKKNQATLADVINSGKGSLNHTGRPNWFNTDELFIEYNRLHGRDPTNKEVLAYYAMKDLNDLEYFLHNSDVLADLSSAGYKKFEVVGAKHNFEGNAKKVGLDKALGNVTYDISTGRVFRPGELSREAIEKLEAKGYKLLDPHESDDLIKEVGAPFRYILVKDADASETILDWVQLNYVPGGHRVYEGKYFIKQGRFMDFDGQKYFLRPQTHMVARLPGEAKKTAENWEKARQAYLRATNGEITETEATHIIAKHTYVDSYDEFARMVDDDVIQANTPFEAVFDREPLPSYSQGTYLGSGSDDLSDIHDWYRSSGRLFYGKKGEHLVDPQGEAATLIHPYKTAALGVKHAMQVTSFNDLSRQVINRFLHTFGNHLELNDSLNFAQNFRRANWKPGTPSEIIAKGEAMRRKHLELLNTPTNETLFMQETMRKLAAQVERMGKPGVARAIHDIHSKDPIIALRSIAFDLKLGLFDPGQLLLQPQAMFAAISIDPARGLRAAASYAPIRYALANGNESVIRYIGKHFKPLHGLSEDEFVELMDDLRRSGVADVSGNIPIMEEMSAGLPGNLMSNPVTRFREAGRFPFIEGEKINQIIGFRMAWKKWKEKNPGKKLKTVSFAGDRAMADIVKEAKLLTVNMSRASNAWWQRGVLSVPTQFASYQARLFELMLPRFFGGSPDLAARQKMQLALGQFFLYGTAGIPLADFITERFQEATGEALSPEIEETLTHGFWDQVIFGWMAGMDTDFSSRAGIVGNGDIISDILDGDSVVEVVGGPVLSVGSGVLKSLRDVWSLRNLAFNEAVAVTPDIINDVFKNVSSYSRATRAITALETGMYLSGKDKSPLIAGVNVQEAIGLALGIPLDQVNRYYDMRNELNDTSKYVREKADHVASLLFNMFEAQRNEDMTKARAVGKQIAFLRQTVRARSERDWIRIRQLALDRSTPRIRNTMAQWLDEKGYTNKLKQSQQNIERSN